MVHSGNNIFLFCNQYPYFYPIIWKKYNNIVDHRNKFHIGIFAKQKHNQMEAPSND